ncbi:MAG TPA: DNA-processing protein DprA [Actinomycetota bacterium]|nr:DNA-processing protein DprA [Actinomycetota bacterium]
MRFRTERGLVLADLDGRAVEPSSDEYPEKLEHLPDPPTVLWVAGRRLDRLPPAVAIVGTRTPTPYGREIARALAMEFAMAGICVVSGLARGIDAEAHLGALDRGTTVAVLPGGIDVCYPSSNRDLYARIAVEGALVAEHEPGTGTRKHRFTHRNRLIAALSLATVVVQAGERSGALSTARHALSIGRDVFAVPGDVRVDVSVGPHELLRDGAAPCTCAGDVIERIGVELERENAVRDLGGLPEDMPAEQRAVLELVGKQTMSAEAVGAMAGFDGLMLAKTLVRLELGGWIARGTGGSVRRLR